MCNFSCLLIFVKTKFKWFISTTTKSLNWVIKVHNPDDLVASTCPFVSGPTEVWAAAGAVMSGALRGQDRNYWTEGGWQRELALGANRCCNHKEIHNHWIKYEVWVHKIGGWVWLCLCWWAYNSSLLQVKAPLIGQLLLWRETFEFSQVLPWFQKKRCGQKPLKKYV